LVPPHNVYLLHREKKDKDQCTEVKERSVIYLLTGTQ
jgi:hypothetical protein